MGVIAGFYVLTILILIFMGPVAGSLMLNMTEKEKK